MERFFQILAVILAGVAAYFLWHGNADRAFVAAVSGAVSFFLSVRVQVKGRLREREAEREAAERREDEERRKEEEDEIDDEIDEIADFEANRSNELPATGTFDDQRPATGDGLKARRTTNNAPRI